MPTIGVEASNARGVLSKTADGVALSVPGTNNIACVITDGFALTADTPLGRLHAGFNDAALSLFAGITAAKLKIDALEGHSEGAAVVLILAGYLCKVGSPPKFVYAFEPPRFTADKALTELLDANSVKRLLTRKGNDIVTQWPKGLKHSDPLTAIGAACWLFDNLADHEMSGVVRAYGG